MNFTSRPLPVNIWLAFLISVFAWMSVGCDSPDVAKTDTEVGTVTVELEFNGRKTDRDFRIPCSQDSTVFSILERARNIGDVKFESSGSGETAFVKVIDGVENEKAAGDNWTFKVNGKLGDRSCGVFQLQPGDTVVWHFGAYMPDE